VNIKQAHAAMAHRAFCGVSRQRDERKVSLVTIAPAAGDTISYTYDSGDEWVHHIEVEKVLLTAPGTTHPCCMTGRDTCAVQQLGCGA
jgi:hypothetical protein